MMEKASSLSVKRYLQKFLDRTGFYQRVKASWVYDFYWRIADRRIIDDRRQEESFYRRVLQGLREGDLIFDVGANRGDKSDIFLRLGASVVAVEPDEASQEILKQRFLQYRLKKKRLVIVPKAASDQCSTQRMLIDVPGSWMNTLSQKWAETLRNDDKRFGHRLDFGRWKEVETVSIEQLVSDYGLPFFVKIDVEGHELSVLRGMQRPVPYLSFEVNLPEFRPEGVACVQTLRRLDEEGRFNYTTDTRRGLLVARWLGPDEFLAVVNSCADPSMEVFWKASVGTR
jgi:FkbM family methyltransferase